MNAIREQRGLAARIGRELGLCRSAVSKWKRVPENWLPDVERISGIPAHELRPDVASPPLPFDPPLPRFRGGARS